MVALISSRGYFLFVCPLRCLCVRVPVYAAGQAAGSGGPGAGGGATTSQASEMVQWGAWGRTVPEEQRLPTVKYFNKHVDSGASPSHLQKWV